MCGIAGFFQTKHSHDRQEMQGIGSAMARAISHRGPDDEGLWQDPDIPLVMLHRRLSIIDLSSEGHQPMGSASGRYMIVYNGEIYNFQNLQRELEEAGLSFRGRSDTEVILAAFDHWGVNQALQKLNGMFAFTLWDRKLHQLHFVRDRLGKKPLYVGWAGDCLVFASELKAVRAHPDFKPVVHRDVLSLFMRYAYVPAPFCIYEGLWQLPAGCRLTLSLDKIDRGANLSDSFEPYWHHPRVVEEARQKSTVKNDAETVDEFESLLKDCVTERMVSDVPLGAFLSGGIDSSAVVALMQKVSDRPVQTFSIGFHESGFDEAGYAKKVAHHLGTDHHELYLTPQNTLDVIPKLPDIYDEPFADASQIPTFMVSRFAREHVSVALSGDGGDEMLGGYLRHIIVPQMWKRIGWWPPFMRRAVSRSLQSVSVERWSRLVPQQPQFGERLYKMAELMPLSSSEEISAYLTGQWREPEMIVKNATEPLAPLTDPAWQPKGLNFAERLIYNDTLSYLPNDILTKVDRATMAVSLEARAPLLDKRIFEYVWGLDMNMKVRDGKGKWLLRQVLARHVPEALFERPKQGFSVPVGEWLHGPLKNWAEDLLAEDRLKQEGYFEPAPIRQIWDEHLQGKGRHAQKLWTVLMFQSWLARWM